MKRRFKSSLIVIALMTSLFSFGQDQMTISFKQTMESDNPDMEMMIDMMKGGTMTVYFKEDKVRTDVINPMTGTIKVIFDGKTGNGITLVESAFVGNQYSVIDSTSEEESSGGIEVVKTKNTKTILGYNCQEYIVTDSTGNVTTLYATASIKGSNKDYIKNGVKGQLLYSETTMTMQGNTMTIKVEATEVNLDDISDDMFDMTIPEGYSVIDTSGL